jgi:hypothetical protein
LSETPVHTHIDTKGKPDRNHGHKDGSRKLNDKYHVETKVGFREEPFEEAADLITNESREEAEGPQLTLIQSA